MNKNRSFRYPQTRAEKLRDMTSVFLARKRAVYVIGSEDGAPVKVGISDNVDRRLRELQADRAEPLQVIYQSEPSGYARRVEAASHETLAPRSMGKEWFDVAPERAISAVKSNIEIVEARMTEPCSTRAKPMSKNCKRAYGH